MAKNKTSFILPFIIGFLLSGLVVGYFANMAISTITQAENSFMQNPVQAYEEFDKVHLYWPFYKESTYFNQFRAQVESSKSAPDVTIYFKPTASEGDIQTLVQQVKSLSGIKTTKYISQQEALEMYKESNKNNPLLLESVTADILPASLEIYTSDSNTNTSIKDFADRNGIVDSVTINKKF